MSISNKTVSISGNLLLIICALAFTLFYNDAFFSNLVRVYPLSSDNFVFLISAGLIVFLLTSILLLLMGWRYTTKPVLMLLFPCTALANYFMNSYNIVIDTTMIQNSLATDVRETNDLFSIRLVITVLLWGILPAAIIYLVKVKDISLKRQLLGKFSLISSFAVLSLALIFLSSTHFASFFRENRILRYYTNPLTYLYSGGTYIAEQFERELDTSKIAIGTDARIPVTDVDRELIILVIGETARSDHFSLNGYDRMTNPMLTQQEVTSFQDVTSCATTTAISLPCMFSLDESEDFDIDNARYSENLLDVLGHAGVATLWRDNNSNSKGVASVEIFEDFRNPGVNHVCDIECRDVGMLEGLDEFISNQDAQDIVIVLHQMGNHGPAYFKRYPKEFEIFTPVCESNQLESCSTEEIINAYDNAILYTDYFLAQVIEFLKGYDDQFETAMVYMSDHGESLGEHALFLHGMPTFIAPKEQRSVPAVIWLGENYEVSNQSLALKKDISINHDVFFHTVLGLMELETEIYQPELDIVHNRI